MHMLVERTDKAENWLYIYIYIYIYIYPDYMPVFFRCYSFKAMPTWLMARIPLTRIAEENL
jgi:hypothetical protein